MARLSRNVLTDDFIAAAKARAKAALNEKHPKLTALEQAFHHAYKQQCPIVTASSPPESQPHKAAKKSTATSKEEQSLGKAQPR
tara:strand:- start:2073 stop:2324 length:252 start_codon:yes stop_codon:yes gene_type:complete